jgi:hypothetical protein
MIDCSRRWTHRLCLLLLLNLWPCLFCLMLIAGFSGACCAPLAWGAVPDRPEQLEQLARHDPLAVLALAHVWQAQGVALPEHVLKAAVETAVLPRAPWEQTEAAIRAFALYQEYPWAITVFSPFTATYASQIVVNAGWFARLHRTWTLRTLASLAPRLPSLLLRELPRLVEIDATWAQGLTETLLAATPTLAFSHAEVLLAVDRPWAPRLLQNVIEHSPRAALAAVQVLLAAPGSQWLFDTAALTDPRWTVGLAASRLPESAAVREALQRSTDPYVQALAQLVQSPYSELLKGRLALLVQDVTEHHMTLDEALRLSNSDAEYFRFLVTQRLAGRHPRPRALEAALKEEVALLIERLNGLHDQPEAVRFHAIAPFTARELYVLLTYGEAEIFTSSFFTSSYRGVFDRLLASMRTEELTGDQLFAQVQDLYFRVFVKSAAFFRRLEAFLATIPAPVARWSLLARCLEDLDLATDVTVEAVTAAELLAAPLDLHSLRVLRDTLKHAYQRAVWEQRHHAMIIYGLLAARFAERNEPQLHDSGLTAIAQRYRRYLPTLSSLPAARLFESGRSIHRYFFYPDEDGMLSFHSFLAQYQHTMAWRIEDKGPFVQVTSTALPRRIEIYANKPTQSEVANQGIDEIMQQQGVAPRVIVHRGHSGHVERTIEKIPATAALVFLGSCGGYNQLAAILRQAPEAQVIATKGIGGMTVNDPLLKALNDYLLTGQDVLWADFWRQAGTLLAGNPRFADYIAPDKNAGLVFLKAYRALTGEQQPAPRPGQLSLQATQSPCLT